MIMFGIVLGVLLFLFLILIHELGHFCVAKWRGVQVLEFGMGIPPKIAKVRTDASGTEYTLNAIPLGGFVRLKGEDPQDVGTFTAHDSFIQASLLSKALILLAGIAVNFVFAWLILTVLFWRGVSPLMIASENASTMEIRSYLAPTISFLAEKKLVSDQYSANVIVRDVLSGALGDQIGLRSGDMILGTQLGAVDTLTFKKNLQQLIAKPFVLDIQRDGQNLSLSGQCPNDNCLLGVLVQEDQAVRDLVYRFSWIQAMGVALEELGYQAQMTLIRLGQFGQSLLSLNTTKIQQEASHFSGPIGAIAMGNELIVRQQWSHFLAFGAMISFALAVFNLLPIPALDGGRLLGVLIQTVFFRKQQEQYFVIESYINFVCFVLLMLLGIYVLFKDIRMIW